MWKDYLIKKYIKEYPNVKITDIKCHSYKVIDKDNKIPLLLIVLLMK